MKIRKVLLELAPLAELAAAGEDGPRLDPIDEVSLLRKAVMNLGLGIAMFHLLPHVALLVGYFDQEFCHASIV